MARHARTPGAHSAVLGSRFNAPIDRLEHKLKIYRLALEQNEKGPERAIQLQRYVRKYELLVEAARLQREAEAS